MSDPNVRWLGGVDDIDIVRIAVGIDYDTVRIGAPSGPAWRLTRTQTIQFTKLLIAACWEAGAQQPTVATEHCCTHPGTGICMCDCHDFRCMCDTVPTSLRRPAR